MKEIGKLIELLNEFEKTTFEEDTNWVYEGEEWEYYEPNNRIIKGNWENKEILTQYELCSKQFGFIKRLIDNEKIYLECFKVYRLDLKPMEHKYVEYSTYEQTLMLLSIQDNPIGFLLSILK